MNNPIFTTKNWIEINKDDAYIIVKGAITVNGQGADKAVIATDRKIINGYT